MSEVLNGVMTVSYGNYKIESFDDLPLASKLAIATSGLAHKLGNEVASKVSAFIDDEANVTDEMTKAEKSAVTSAWKIANAELLAAKKKELTDAAFDQILTGVASSRSTGPRGPKLDEFAATVRQVAYNAVAEVLVKSNLLAKNAAGEYVIPGTSRKPVSGGKTPDILITGTNADGTPDNRTMAMLVDRRLANPARREQDEKVAKRIIELKRKEAEKNAATVEELD